MPRPQFPILRSAALPGHTLAPLRLERAHAPFDDRQWLFEVKHGGFRAMGVIHDTKAAPEVALLDGDGAIRYVDHVRGRGQAFFELCCRVGLEGTVAKRCRDRYLFSHAPRFTWGAMYDVSTGQMSPITHSQGDISLPKTIRTFWDWSEGRGLPMDPAAKKGERDPAHGEARRANNVNAALAPSVKHVRIQLFGRSRAPFRSYRKAVEWINAESPKRPKEAGDRFDYMDVVGQPATRRRKSGNIIPGVERIWYWPDTPLGQLATATGKGPKLPAALRPSSSATCLPVTRRSSLSRRSGFAVPGRQWSSPQATRSQTSSSALT